MTLIKPKIYDHPAVAGRAQPELHPEPVAPLTVAERNDQIRHGIMQRAFGSAQAAAGTLHIDSARALTGAERDRILHLVLEHGTHRGDVFEDEAHTRAVLNGCEFTLQDGALLVKVSR